MLTGEQNKGPTWPGRSLCARACRAFYFLDRRFYDSHLWAENPEDSRSSDARLDRIVSGLPLLIDEAECTAAETAQNVTELRYVVLRGDHVDDFPAQVKDYHQDQRHRDMSLPHTGQGG